MDVEVRELTTYQISADGQSVVVKLLDEAGQPVSLRFPIPELGNLVTTLPGLIEKALRRQFSDAELRFAYPMGSWSIDRSTDPNALLVTLRTEDDFGVSFSMPRAAANRLASSIQVESVSHEVVLAH